MHTQHTYHREREREGGSEVEGRSVGERDTEKVK